MKVVWSMDHRTAIPLSNIKCFEIGSVDEREGGKYYVFARYTICTGASATVYEANTKEKCIKFIEDM